MTTSDTLRVGIIGAGANTRGKHIPLLQAIDGVEIACVANRTQESGRRAAVEFSIPTVYDDWHQVIADDTVDAVVIGTWPYLHHDATIAALEAGKHVLCEARMAMNAPEAWSMLDCARRHSNQVAQLVPAPFTLRVDATVRAMIDEGRLGEILAVDVNAAQSSFLDREAELNWRQDESKSGCNTMMLGIWYESIMRWVGDAARVMALGKVYARERLNPETGETQRIEIPDHLDVLADLRDGGQLRIRCSAVTGAAPPMGVIVYGSEATLRYDAPSDQLFLAPRETGEFVPVDVAPELAGGWRVEEEFINAIRGREPVRLTTFEDGVKYMEFTEAVWTSRQWGRMISLPLERDA